MIKKTRFYFAILLLCIPILLGGCQTCKGMAYGISDGFPRDVEGFWGAMRNLDNWIKRNLW